MPAHDDFFNADISADTRTKLDTLAWFLTPWTAKLNFWARRRGSPRLWYVDAFAGTGHYPDGALGSPLLAAQRALVHNAGGGAVPLAIFAVERKPHHFAQLQTAVAEYVAKGIRLELRNGAFVDYVSEIADMTAGSPLLLFVDPFGLRGFEPRKLAPLLDRDTPIDIIFRLHHRAIPRLAPRHPDIITGAVGGAEWRDAWETFGDSERTIEEVLQLFSRSLQRIGKLNTLMYPVRPIGWRAPTYTLAFASRNIEALRLWTDRTGELDLDLASRPQNPEQFEMLPAASLQSRLEYLDRNVLSFYVANPNSDWQSAYDWIMLNTQAPYKETELTKCIERQILAGALVRSGPGKAIRNHATFRATT